MNYDQFIAAWNTKQVTKYGSQCVALVAEYEAENNLPIVWGDASAWVNNPVMLTHYNWVQNDPNDANQVPNRGDIIVWGSDLPFTNGAGHIAFFDHAIDHQVFQSFGQNSGGPSAHFQTSHWAHVAGWYVAKQPVAPAPQPPAEKYHVVEEYPGGKLIKLNKQPTNLWGMNFDFNYMKDHPVETHDAGEVWTVTNKVQHVNGYQYYRREGQVDGFNILDCDDYTPPPPPPVLPSAPLPIPTDTTPYTVVKTILGFTSSNDAANHINAKTTVDAGQYFIFNRRSSPTDPEELVALNLTLIPGKAGTWINPNDNEEEPAPPPPEPPKVSDWTDPRTSTAIAEANKPTETTPVPVTVVHNPNAWKKPIPLNEEREPELFVSMNTTAIKLRDLDSKLSPLELEPLTGLHIQDTFIKDGVHYARTVKMAYEGLYFALPVTILEPATYKGARPTDYVQLWREKIKTLIHDVFVKNNKEKRK